MNIIANSIPQQNYFYSNSSDCPKLLKSFPEIKSFLSRDTDVYAFATDSTNRLLLSGFSTKPRYIFYDLDTLEQVGSYDSKESNHCSFFSCLFLSDTVCAVSSSEQIEIFSFKREDPPEEEKEGESIKISGCTQIKILPLHPSASASLNSLNHTITSLNSVQMNNNNNIYNFTQQLVLGSHRESCLSFWRTPSKNQLDRSYYQYHQVGFLDLEKTYDFSAKSCRAKFVKSSSSSSFCNNSSSENSANFVCTYLSGFCLFKVSWSENEQKQKEEDVFIELLRKIKLSDSVDKYSIGYGFTSIDVALNFVVAHAALGNVAYLYDLNNFRVVSELKATTGNQNNFPVIKISEYADVVVLGTRVGNIHFFTQENNWKEVTFQQQQAFHFGDYVCDLHLCSDRQLVIAGGLSTDVRSTPMKIYRAPLIRSLWNRRRIVFLLQNFSGLRKTKQMLDMYVVRQCLALFL